MPTVDDYYARMQLTDEDKQAAATRALMMAAAAAFASNDGRPLGSILGNTMFAGVGSYDNSLTSAKRSKMDDIAFRKQAMDLANADKKMEEEKMLAEAMRGAAAPNATTFGPPSQSADAGPPAPSSAPMSGKERERQMLTNTINALIAKGGGHMVGPLQDRLAKLDVEFSPEVRYDQNGRGFLVGKDGSMKLLDGIKARDEIISEDLGGKKQYRTKFDTKPLGEIAKTITPGEAMSGAETRRHNLMSEQTAQQSAGNQVVTNEGKVRDDYNAASKAFVTVRDAHQRVLASAQNPSAAGDLALIFNYMKVLDPGSTVREGEFATAQNAGGVDDRVRALWNRALNGQRLPPNIREDFVNRSGMLYKAAEDNQAKIEEAYSGIATRGGMNPANVVIRSRVQDAPRVVDFNSLPMVPR